MKFKVGDRVRLTSTNTIGTVTGTKWTPEEETLSVLVDSIKGSDTPIVHPIEQFEHYMPSPLSRWT